MATPAGGGRVPASVMARRRNPPPRTISSRPSRDSSAMGSRQSRPPAGASPAAASTRRLEARGCLRQPARPALRAPRRARRAPGSSAEDRRWWIRDVGACRPRVPPVGPVGCGAAYACLAAVSPSCPHGGSSRMSTHRITNGRIISRMAGSRPSRVANCHLVDRVAEEALREELAADDDVPPHREDADQRQAARRRRRSSAAPVRGTGRAASPRACASGTTVPTMICSTICEVNSRVCTMKSRARNDSSDS